MFRKKSAPGQIEDLLTDHWERGFKSGAEWQNEADREVLEEEKGYAYSKGSEESYKKGRSDQKAEDERKLNEEKADAYEQGYDKGFNKGYSAGLKDGGNYK